MTAATSITVRVPMKIHRRPGHKMMVMPALTAGGEGTITTRADPALVKALARAFRYQRLLDEGTHASITEMAAAEKIERGYLGSLLRLTLLAPDIIESILNGRSSGRLCLATIEAVHAANWSEQRTSVNKF